jgi:hypothetical protein
MATAHNMPQLIFRPARNPWLFIFRGKPLGVSRNLDSKSLAKELFSIFSVPSWPKI